MFVVGLTGGVGSGKTTVADLLATHGVDLIDADVVAREVVEPKTPGLRAIIDHFGQDFLTPDGALDRAKLAATVFADPAALGALNAITHPLVRARVNEQLDALRSTDHVVLLVVPLLVESSYYKYDALIVVDVDEEVAVQRAVAQRGWSEEQARARVGAQANRQTRIDAADFVIDNSGGLDDLSRRVEDAWQWLEVLLRSAD